MNFPSQIFFNDINYGYRAVILKKNSVWLVPFYIVWLLISVMKRCAERCALHLYQTSLTCLNQMTYREKAEKKLMAKLRENEKNFFFQQKCFWSEPKTFASFPGVSFVLISPEFNSFKSRLNAKHFNMFFASVSIKVWSERIRVVNSPSGES